MTPLLMRHYTCDRKLELSLAKKQWFADERDSRCDYYAGGRHIRTGSSMTPAAAVGLSDIDEANGFVTERISVVKMGSEPPEFRAIIAPTPAAGCHYEQPAPWEYWMGRGWLQIGPPRKRFEPSLQEVSRVNYSCRRIASIKRLLIGSGCRT